MAAYATPSPDFVRQLGGAHEDIQGLEESDLDRHFAILSTLAEAELALSLEVSDLAAEAWTPPQVTVCQAAVGYKMLAKFYRAVAGQKASGSQEPLLMEESRALLELAADYEAQAMALAGIISPDDPLTGPGELDFGRITSKELLDYYRHGWLGPLEAEVR